MRKSNYDPTQRFQTIPNAVRTTGLSACFLRNGCRAGTVPHVRSGRLYMVDVPRLYEVLEQRQNHPAPETGTIRPVPERPTR